MHRTAGQQVAGKRSLLIVGAGESGADIVAEVSQHAAETVLSLRRGVAVLARSMFGEPKDYQPEMRPSLTRSDEKKTAEGYTDTRFWCDRGREALVLAARLSAGPESRLPAPFPVATLAVSTQSRLFVIYAVLPPGPKGAGDGSRV